MRTRNRLHAGFFAFAILVAGAAEAAEPIEPFVIAGDDPADFIPLGEIVTAGSIAFMPGVSFSTDAAGDAALVAFDAHRRQEVWRATLGAEASYENFTQAVTSSASVCAAGSWVGSTTLTIPRAIACYRAGNGRLLWQRELEVGQTGPIWNPRPTRSLLGSVTLSIAKQTLLIRLPGTAFLGYGDATVMAFDVHTRD